MALKSVVALLLVMVLLGMFGLWALVPPLLVMAIFLSLYMLVVSLLVRATFLTFMPIFPLYIMPYSLLDPRLLGVPYPGSQQQEEDFKPFVFKDHTQKAEQA